MNIGELIAADLAADDELLAGAVISNPTLPSGPPSMAADGPRAASDPASYRYSLEAIREGYRLHYGQGVIVSGEADLELLAGDRLYAAGLERMAQTGDLQAVAELSRLIQACARAAADGNPDLAEEAWSSSCGAIGGLDSSTEGR